MSSEEDKKQGSYVIVLVVVLLLLIAVIIVMLSWHPAQETKTESAEDLLKKYRNKNNSDHNSPMISSYEDKKKECKNRTPIKTPQSSFSGKADKNLSPLTNSECNDDPWSIINNTRLKHN